MGRPASTWNRPGSSTPTRPSRSAPALTGNRSKRSGAGVPLQNVRTAPFDGYLGPDTDTLDQLERLLDDPAQLHLALQPQPVAEAEVTLVTPWPRLTYSGMVPGFVAGHYTLEQCSVPLAPMAERAGVRPAPVDLGIAELPHAADLPIAGDGVARLQLHEPVLDVRTASHLVEAKPPM